MEIIIPTQGTAVLDEIIHVYNVFNIDIMIIIAINIIMWIDVHVHYLDV